ncbi:MAG TPA: SulP family inorganic anion transporter, partial [Terriglobales bacterium]|nr:SulP family inorganic anion transporter [Terriglobales bacterium]
MPLSRPRFPVPGLDALREAAAHYLSAAKAPAPRLPRDLVAGVNTAIVAVPGNMAASLLVGVNPLFGLYAGMVGPLVGGAASSTQLMIVTATTAAALTAGQSLTATPAAQREPTLAVMVVVVGILLLLLGGLRLTVIMRFVSYSVMTGLLTGISVVIVLSQLPLIAGYAANGGNRLAQTYDLFTHLSGVHLQSVAVAALTLALAVLLPRTGVRHAGILLAMVIPSVLIHLIHWDSVPLVSTAGALVPGLPALRWPAWETLHFAVITGAASVTVIVLVQSTGVSQEAPNPDGAPIRLARDFLAQGAANLAAGFLQSLPVGGSVSETALSIASGARTRFAAIFSGLFMALVLLVATAWVGQVALAALEALLIFAGISSLQWVRIHSVWRNGWHARAAGVATFAAVLLLPIQAAVGIGMALSGLLYLGESAADIRVLQLRELPDG